MSKKNNSNDYNHYTSQGADLSSAHSDYTEYHEANHQSFFNMHNAAGLFKLFIIGGIILIVIVVLSPLFKLFKDLVGAGNAAAGFLTNLFKMCESIGTCNPNNTYCGDFQEGGPGPKPSPCPAYPPGPTPKPGASVPGTCDGAGGAGYPKGSSCQTIDETDSSKGQTPPSPCGSKISKMCKLLLAGWLFSSFIMAAFAGLASLFEKWRNKDPGETGESDKSLAENEPDLAKALNDARSDAAKLDDDGLEDRAKDDIMQDQVDKLRGTKAQNPWEGEHSWSEPPADIKDLYKHGRSIKSPFWGEWKLRKPTDHVSKISGIPCLGWGGPSACADPPKGEGSEPDDYHGIKLKNGWTFNQNNPTDGSAHYDLNAAAKAGKIDQKYANSVKDAWKNKIKSLELRKIKKQKWKDADLEKRYKDYQEKYKALENNVQDQAENAKEWADLQKSHADLEASLDDAGLFADDADDAAGADTPDPVEG